MVAIKDMEIPRSCFYCPFRKSASLLDDGGGYYCRLQPIGTDGVLAKSQYAINGEFKNKQGCPLVEVEEQKIEKLGEIEQILKARSFTDDIGNACYLDDSERIGLIKEVLESEEE